MEKLIHVIDPSGEEYLIRSETVVDANILAQTKWKAVYGPITDKSEARCSICGDTGVSPSCPSYSSPSLGTRGLTMPQYRTDLYTIVSCHQQLTLSKQPLVQTPHLFSFLTEPSAILAEDRLYCSSFQTTRHTQSAPSSHHWLIEAVENTSSGRYVTICSRITRNFVLTASADENGGDGLVRLESRKGSDHQQWGNDAVSDESR